MDRPNKPRHSSERGHAPARVSRASVEASSCQTLANEAATFCGESPSRNTIRPFLPLCTKRSSKGEEQTLSATVQTRDLQSERPIRVCGSEVYPPAARAYPPTLTSMLSTSAFFSTSLSKKLGPFAGVARPFLPPPGPLHAVANAACFSASS